MSYKCTYYFDQLPLHKGLAIYAEGEAEISYRVFPSEPDIGIFHKYIGDIEINSITIYGDNDDKLTKTLERQSNLYSIAEEALREREETLASYCEEHYRD